MMTRPKPRGRLFVEKRRFQRLNIALKIKYRLLPRKRVLEETICKDISGGGVRFILDVPIKAGNRLKTMIYFPNSPRPVRAVSRVVWCKEISGTGKRPSFEVGIRHLKIETRDRERFVLLFCEMMINFSVFGKVIKGERRG